MSFYKINPLEVNWESESSCLFFNNRHGKKDLFTSYIPHLPQLKSHIWLATSGRVYQKWVALSKKALLTSAEAVNRHLDATSKDRWGLSLPLFHVGGLSILARAHLSGSPYFAYDGKWSAKAFLDFLNEHKITLSSLVPTQVYDLVKAGLNCPSFVKAIVVGGESLSPSLYKAARDLNWPLLPSYGLTECGSQVATAELGSLRGKKYPPMRVLSHVQVKVVREEMALRSESLMSGFVPLLDLKDLDLKKGQVFWVPACAGMTSLAGMTSVAGRAGEAEVKEERGFRIKSGMTGVAGMMKKAGIMEEGWYFTGDKGELREDFLQVKKASQIKIRGEKVNIKNLEETLMSILLKKSEVLGRCFLLPVPSEREGFQLSLVSDVFDPKIMSEVIKEFNKHVSPFEKIQQFYFVPELPLTGISKVSKQALLEILGFSPKNPT